MATGDARQAMSSRTAGAGQAPVRVPHARHHRRTHTTVTRRHCERDTVPLPTVAALTGTARVRRLRKLPRSSSAVRRGADPRGARRPDKHASTALDPQGPSKRRRSLLPGREEVFKLFTLRTPPNMSRHAKCKACGWERSAVFTRLKEHAETHVNGPKARATGPADGVPGATKGVVACGGRDPMHVPDAAADSNVAAGSSNAPAPAHGSTGSAPCGRVACAAGVVDRAGLEAMTASEGPMQGEGCTTTGKGACSTVLALPAGRMVIRFVFALLNLVHRPGPSATRAAAAAFRVAERKCHSPVRQHGRS